MIHIHDYYFLKYEPINAEKVLLYLYLIYSFKKQMWQAANTDLYNPSVPKAHNSERQHLPFPLQFKPVKVSWS